MKMKGVLLFSCMSVLLGISGCSQSVPECSATETIDLVKKVADSEMINQIGSDAEGQFSYALHAISTTSTHEKTGAHQCSAELEITFKETNEKMSSPVKYSVALTDDGKEIYVNLYEM